MKPNINISKGESTAQHVQKAVEKYLNTQNRIVPIKEVYEVLSQTNETVSRMSKQGFENIAGEQIIAHAMKQI